MNAIVAPAREARQLIRNQIVADGAMRRVVFEGTGPEMAVETFTVIVGRVKMDRLGCLAKILHVNMVQTADLCADPPVQNIVGVACVARFIGGNTMVLEVYRGYKVRVVNVQAAAVGFHNVAGKAEARLFGLLKMLGEPEPSRHKRQQK